MTSFQPGAFFLAKAKSHTHTLSHQGYLTQVISVLYTQRNKRAYMSSIYIHSRSQSHSSNKCALHTKQESLHELYLLIQSLKESIHSKCNLNVHVKFHRMKSASRYTDYDQTVNLSIVMIAGPPAY